MKRLYLFILIFTSGSFANKIVAQDNYTLSTVKISFSYTKKVTSRGTSTLVITGNNENAPVAKGADGSIIVCSKNFSGAAAAQSGQSNPAMPMGGASAFNSPNYNKFFLQVNQEHSLHGTMSYTHPGDALKGVPDINFFFNYDAINKLGSIGIGGSSASEQTITTDGATKIIDGTIGGGLGASTDIAKSLYGFDGMQKDSNTVYIQLSKTQTGYRISYHKITKENNGEHGETTSTTTEDMIAYIGEPDEMYEAIITPYNCDYEHWLPTGPTVDGKNDSRGDVVLQFNLDVHKKGDPSFKYPGKMNISWHLGNVTNYPGFCNNYPAYSTSPDITPDLVFNPDLKQNAAFTSVNNTDAIANGVFAGDAVAKIMCMDYAAWGKLSAVVTLDDGSSISAVSAVESGKQYVTIPFDKDENKLADAWEKDNNQQKHPLTWDEDAEPSPQRENGDGYTLFEEYRGFAIHINADENIHTEAREDFVRTNPNHKDAFIFDPEKLFQTHYEPYNPSELNWHYISADQHQMYYDDNDIKRPLNRWVNFNKVSDYFYSEQYALVIKTTTNVYKYDKLATGISFTASEWQYALDKNADRASTNEVMEQLTKENNGTIDVFKNPMKMFIKIEIIPARIAQKCLLVKQQLGEAAYNLALQTNIGNTVRHEIGHCIGIHHHKPTADSGPESCVMRYLSNNQRNDVNYLKAIELKYCKNGQTGPDYIHTPRTGEIPEGEENYTETPANTSSSDNCYGQITVKSKKE